MSRMDERIVQFIKALRAAGVRVSLAESQDAFFATRSIGVTERERFRAALKTTLVKEHSDEPVFDHLFPLYFGAGEPPLMPASEALSPEEMELLRAALQALAGRLSELLERMLEGQGPTPEEMDQAAQQAGLDFARGMHEARWITRRALRQMGLQDILDQIEALLQELARLGMSAEAREQLRALLEGNAEAIRRQMEQRVGAGLAERMAEDYRPRPRAGDLMDRPFQMLSEDEIHLLRKEVARLAARLRTRAALRQRRGKGSRLDAKATLRTNVRYAGVPFEIITRERRKKARFTVLCDVSTSMRPVVYFLLLLVYQMQDLVGRTRSFAYIDHMEEISDDFAEHRPEVAIPTVLRRLPPGHYNTDLGASLDQFVHEHLDAVDSRTTLILCGDGRNNYNDPRTDLVEMLRRRARKFVWFNPEPPARWGSGDSDMPAYAPLVDAVYQVSNLRQLSEAVDRLFL